MENCIDRAGGKAIDCLLAQARCRVRFEQAENLGRLGARAGDGWPFWATWRTSRWCWPSSPGWPCGRCRIGATWARCAATRGLRVGFGSLTSSPEQRWASSQEQGGSAPERKDGPQRRRSGFERIRAGGEVGAGRSRRWSSERQAGHGGWQRSWNSLPLRARGAVRFWRCAGRIFGNGKSELRFLRSSETASAGVAS